MYKRKILLILINLSFLCASLKYDSVKVGISESLGVFGLISMDFKLSNISNENDVFYFTMGTLPLPIFGGAGFTYKKYFNIFEIDPISNTFIKPYISTTIFSSYIMGPSDSPAKTYIMGTLGFGADFSIIKINTTSINIQTGVFTQYNFSEGEIFESPSDQPEIWPAINIKISQ